MVLTAFVSVVPALRDDNSQLRAAPSRRRFESSDNTVRHPDRECEDSGGGHQTASDEDFGNLQAVRADLSRPEDSPESLRQARRVTERYA